MRELKTFISPEFRPEVLGGKLDQDYKSLFKLSPIVENPEYFVNAICFGARKDNVLINLEHVISKEDQIYIFYYEDLHIRWSYIATNDEQYFLYKKNEHEQYKIKPNYLYIRGCYIEPKDKYWVFVGDFFNFVESWNGKVLCSPYKQMPNESKLYQINNSLRKSLKPNANISLGVSYVIKGSKKIDLLRKDSSYIVKSLSGVRSIVVDENNYSSWDVTHINNLPVLFQEKVVGNDLRAHVIGKQIFCKKSNFKEKVDYRYDANFFNLIDVKHLESDFVNFCLSVSQEEKNKLLGIDFIQHEAGYVVLEANPSPGWSAYHPYNGIDDDPFILELLKVLKNAEI